MPIETIDDIIEEIADRRGIYGAHGDESDDDTPSRTVTCTATKPCRVCWTCGLHDRIVAAVEIERQLSPLNRITRIQRLGDICAGLTGKDLETVAELARSFAERSPLTPGGCRGTKEIIIAFGQPHMMGKCPGCADCMEIANAR